MGEFIDLKEVIPFISMGELSFCYLGFTANLGVSNQTTENKTKSQNI